jgi:hypothetical protein
MGCCVSSPTTNEGTHAPDQQAPKAKASPKRKEVLKIGKEEAKRREQHWKVTGIVGLRSSNIKVRCHITSYCSPFVFSSSCLLLFLFSSYSFLLLDAGLLPQMGQFCWSSNTDLSFAYVLKRRVNICAY